MRGTHISRSRLQATSTKQEKENGKSHGLDGIGVRVDGTRSSFFVRGRRGHRLPWREHQRCGRRAGHGLHQEREVVAHHLSPELANGIRHIADATAGKPAGSWKDSASAVGGKTPGHVGGHGHGSGFRFRARWSLRSWRPKAAEKLMRSSSCWRRSRKSPNRDRLGRSLPPFGSPTNRAIREGYWESPKGIPGIQRGNPSEGSRAGLERREHRGLSESPAPILSVKHSARHARRLLPVSVAVIPGTETEIPPFETAREKAATESGLPENLFRAFNGNEERIREFMAKVAKLGCQKLDEHEFSCGRALARKRKSSASPGRSDFFLGADPLEVCGYIEEVHSASNRPVDNSLSGGNTMLGDALRKADSRPRIAFPV